MVSLLWGLSLFMVSGLGHRAAVYAQTVTLHDVFATASGLTQIDSESFSFSAGGVGADGATTYVGVVVESFAVDELASTTVTFADKPFTATVTRVEDASGYRLTSPEEICEDGVCTVDTTAPPDVRTCSFGADGQGSCVQQLGGESRTLTWSGSVVPIYTLPAATGTPAKNHAAAAASLGAVTTSMLALSAVGLVLCAM
ncbi:hypothetical protein C8F04DRAFT_1273822 [Mycena alexandri]|uniref:Uncharacterized protein n=1 Tax=Mycena alexandri TaxID=1745969 RepID=A0AAD6S5U2_9AGAR|nr:hypothetical protein C8F04DRAFT_1273822 [Mycena alexandri]